MSFNTPILFLCFNRPDETKKSFSNIKKIQPTKLYIAQDGPRDEEDREKTIKVHDIIKDISWPCDVHYLIRDENLGLRRAVNEAVDWFFEAEEMGIVIEDDILPDVSFFHFATILLTRFQYDTRIMLICGNNLLNEHHGHGDYFFSKTGAIWGWASWRRAWQLHDKEMKQWEQIKIDNVAKQILSANYWDERVKNMDEVLMGNINSWSYVFTMTRLINSGLSIIPRKNLIQNIGFNMEGTHTREKPHYFKNEIYSLDVTNLEHPIVIAPDVYFDEKLYQLRNPSLKFSQQLKHKLKMMVKKAIKKQ